MSKISLIEPYVRIYIHFDHNMIQKFTSVGKSNFLKTKILEFEDLKFRLRAFLK